MLHDASNTATSLRAPGCLGSLGGAPLQGCVLVDGNYFAKSGSKQQIQAMKQLLFCGAACIVATLGTAAKQQTDTVPFYLVTAAQRPFAEFMFQVANASVRAGIELKEIDNAAVSRAPARPKGETTQVPREELVAAIHARKPGYQAAWDGDVLLIRPVNGRLKFLDSPLTLTSPATIVGVMQSLRTIMAPLDARLLQPAVGTGKGWEALKALSANITVDGSNGRTVVDTLNQVVLQNQGAWRVMTRRTRLPG